MAKTDKISNYCFGDVVYEIEEYQDRMNVLIRDIQKIEDQDMLIGVDQSAIMNVRFHYVDKSLEQLEGSTSYLINRYKEAGNGKMG